MTWAGEERRSRALGARLMRWWLRAFDALDRVVRRQGRDLVELENTALCIGYGLIFAGYADVFSATTSTGHMLFPRSMWAVILLACGLLGLLSYFSRQLLPRIAWAFCGVILWTLMSITIGILGRSPLAFLTFAVFAAGSFYTFVTVGVREGPWIRT